MADNKASGIPHQGKNSTPVLIGKITHIAHK